LTFPGYKPKPGSAWRCISRTPRIRRLAPWVSWDWIPRPPRGSRESYFSLPDSSEGPFLRPLSVFIPTPRGRVAVYFPVSAVWTKASQLDKEHPEQLRQWTLGVM